MGRRSVGMNAVSLSSSTLELETLTGDGRDSVWSIDWDVRVGLDGKRTVR